MKNNVVDEEDKAIKKTLQFFYDNEKKIVENTRKNIQEQAKSKKQLTTEEKELYDLEFDEAEDKIIKSALDYAYKNEDALIKNIREGIKIQMENYKKANKRLF